MKNKIAYKEEVLNVVYFHSSKKTPDAMEFKDCFGIDHLVMFLGDIERKNNNKDIFYCVWFRDDIFVSKKIDSIIRFVVGINHKECKSSIVSLTEHLTIKSALKEIKDNFKLEQWFKKFIKS